MTLATKGTGTTLERGNGATPEIFTPIVELRKFTPPKGTREEKDVTHLLSSAKEFLKLLRDFGSASGSCNWIPLDPTQDWETGLMQAFNDGVTGNWRVAVREENEEDPISGAVICYATFAAWVKVCGLEEIAPESEKLLSFELRATGPVEYTEP
jgi:hypothetical protein